MQTFSVASVLALLASVAAGLPLGDVNTLRADTGEASPALNDASRGVRNPASTGSLQGYVPDFTMLRVDGKYTIALGDNIQTDVRDDVSVYVYGTREFVGTTFHIDRSAGDEQFTLIAVDNGPMSSGNCIGWALGVHRYYPSDSFGNPLHSLRVIAHADHSKSALWTFVPHPHTANTMVLLHSSDETTKELSYWYLTLSDSADAERDPISTYLTVTDDPYKAATVAFTHW